MGMPRDYRELDRLRRGMEIIYRGIRTRCVYVHRLNGAGVGMGEYPAYIIAYFENGLVLRADEWNPGVQVIEKPFHEAKPEF